MALDDEVALFELTAELTAALLLLEGELPPPPPQAASIIVRIATLAILCSFIMNLLIVIYPIIYLIRIALIIGIFF